MSLIPGFIVCGVHIMHPAAKACLHDGQILIRQCYIEHQVRLELPYHANQCIDIVRVDRGGTNGYRPGFPGYGVTLFLGSACKQNFFVDIFHPG